MLSRIRQALVVLLLASSWSSAVGCQKPSASGRSEAESIAQQIGAKLLTKCGNSSYLVVGYMAMEYRDPTVTVYGREITPAAEANGIQWDGSFRLHAKLGRIAGPINIKYGPGVNPETGGWNDNQFVTVQIRKVKDQWHVMPIATTAPGGRINPEWTPVAAYSPYRVRCVDSGPTS
jgi:hypothetical protein